MDGKLNVMLVGKLNVCDYDDQSSYPTNQTDDLDDEMSNGKVLVSQVRSNRQNNSKYGAHDGRMCVEHRFEFTVEHS